MNSKEYEEQLTHLTNDQYDSLLQERIARLNPEQQKIAQAREVRRLERQKLISKLADPNATEDDNEMVFNALRDVKSDYCEHGRFYCKSCVECEEMDHLMFPELFDKDGSPLVEDE